jgi:hypothetical protein
MFFDRLDGEWRCLLCGRARRKRVRVPAADALWRRHPAFRRKWDVPAAELLVDCG